MKKVCCTGGAGFLGSAVVKALCRTHSVVVLDDTSRGSWDRLDNVPCHRVPGDIRNPKWVDLALGGCDSVIHMAAINGTQNFYDKPGLVLDVGIRGTLNVIDACKKHAIREFLFVSSSEVYQTPNVVPTPETVALMVPDVHNPRYSYGGSKIIGEQLALYYGAFDRLLLVRPHNVYGPDGGRDHVIPQLCRRVRNLSGNPLRIQGTGEESRAFCYVEDFVAGLLTVLEKGSHGEVYNIGSPVETTIKDVIGKLFWLAGIKEGSVAIVPSEAPSGGTSRRCPDVSKLKALGWDAKWDLIDGLHDTLRWYDRNPEAVK